MTSPAPTVKLAVLIDADNASHNMIGFVLAEIAKYGTAFVKRAYGDWTAPTLRGWRERLLENSIQPIQQFAYTVGKNATDSAMIIDAMDLLYSNKFDGFCIVSSDSDFTRLASRIRESGLVVYGCGKRNTARPFVTACDKFIYVENLVPRMQTPTLEEIGGPSGVWPLNARHSLGEPSHAKPLAIVSSKGKERARDKSSSPEESNEKGRFGVSFQNKEGDIQWCLTEAEARPEPRKTPTKGESSTPGPSDPRPSNGATSNGGPSNSSSTDQPAPKRKRANSDAEIRAQASNSEVTIGQWSQLLEWLREAVDGSPDEDGWVRLADVGQLMLRRHPDFDPRNYNFGKLSELIRSMDAFDYDRRYPAPGKSAIIYVRQKSGPAGVFTIQTK
ncbi:hypothetical protein FBEOM_858 [Fusarium beomiforme]|uniref:HTH OST-type domain-containing protein n=1 Tax=Fusarium beomiforme TaxID=44412 RepID=A0A9P5AV76_9HYPO|nr:hypothetical protein FBEOM_858 [Fusarium beomiforme]